MRQNLSVTWQALALAGLVLIDVEPLRAQSEAVIRGQVVAAADGSALAQATATLRGVSGHDSAHALTDQAGRFVFQHVRPGKYVLSVSAEGFDARQLRFVLEPRELKVVSLSLELARLNVNVSVEANPEVIPSTHSPSSTVLTSERLETLPVSQRANLPDAIVTAAPGMIRGHDDFVHVRGHEIALNPPLGRHHHRVWQRYAKRTWGPSRRNRRRRR